MNESNEKRTFVWNRNFLECIIILRNGGTKGMNVFLKFSHDFVMRSISHSSRGIFTRSRKLEWKMMEFNDGWKFEILRFLTILSTVSSRCNKSSAVQSFLSIVYFRSIENCIWNARGTEKTSTKIYVNKRKLFNFNDNNLFNGNHSSDYSVFAFQLSVPLPSLPPRIRINLHSLDYHHGNHVPTTFNNE